MVPFYLNVINFIFVVEVKNENMITFEMKTFCRNVGKTLLLCTAYNNLTFDIVFCLCNCSIQGIIDIRETFKKSTPNCFS